MSKEYLVMRQEEARRLTVISKLIDGHLSVAQAAEYLQLSIRQVLRIKKRVLEEGEAGVIHKNRGRQPSHTLPQSLKQKIVALYQSDDYRGCNDTHFTELLAQRENIYVSTSTVRRILRAAGISAARKHRAPRAHRSRRRMPQAGLLWQMDASTFDWLEDRGPRLTLHAAIDDATGRIVGAAFAPTECLEGYWSVLHQGITAYGIPVALYVDRHTIFRSPKADKLTIDEELAGVKPSTQLGRAVAELGISLTFARSPQAKGRIERLWETLQDRLTHELRLHRISTLEAANAFLRAFVERFNARFAVEPESPEPAYRPLAPHHDLHRILCHRAWRKISPGQTISWKGQTYRMAPAQHQETLAPRSTVEVRVTADGELWIAAGQGRLYRLEPCPKSPTVQRREDVTPTPSRQSYKPPADHPWRRMTVGRPKPKLPSPSAEAISP
nr:ISNCY family transposase [Alicyclobacillus sendaiensis]